MTKSQGWRHRFRGRGKRRGHAGEPRVKRLWLPLLAAVLCGVAAGAVAPSARTSWRLLANRDDPAALTDIVLEERLNATIAATEIEAALKADDADLAASFLELARDRGIAVDPGLATRVEDANATRAKAARAARSYVRGIITGAPDDVAGFAGTMTRDLSGWGDVDDAVTQTAHLANGEPADEVVLGLACVGLVATAATVATVGAAAPVRAGVSIVKAARRTGRLAGPLVLWAKRSLRGAIDAEKLEVALGKVSIMAPAESTAVVRDAVRDAVKLDRLEGVVATMSDVGRIQSSAGTRAALEGLKLSETPQDVARVARLAEKEGSKTGAILKLAGRSAFVLTVVALNLVSWVASGLWLIIGFLVAIKSTTERATAKVVRWRRKRRAALRAAAATA